MKLLAQQGAASMTAGSPLPSASTTDLTTQEPVEMAKALWRNLSIACTAALLFQRVEVAVTQSTLAA